MFHFYVALIYQILSLFEFFKLSGKVLVTTALTHGLWAKLNKPVRGHTGGPQEISVADPESGNVHAHFTFYGHTVGDRL